MTARAVTSLRHDEQGCESYYDDRQEAENDLRKGTIQFPREQQLFGRDKELEQLEEIYRRSCCCCASGSSASTSSSSSSPDQSSTPSSSSSSSSSPDIQQTNMESQIVFLQGYSGVGKSALIQQGLIQRLQDRNLPFLYGSSKYNEHISADPFSAIAQALSQLCSNLLGLSGAVQPSSSSSSSSSNSPTEERKRKKGRVVLRKIQHNLKRAGIYKSSEEAAILLELFPMLSDILASEKKTEEQPNDTTSTADDENSQSIAPVPPDGHHDDRPSSSSKHDDVQQQEQTKSTTPKTHGLQQVVLVFSTFLRALYNCDCNITKNCRCSCGPFILFLDDLQWADPASLKLLASILADTSIPHFLFIGSFRRQASLSSSSSSSSNSYTHNKKNKPASPSSSNPNNHFVESILHQRDGHHIHRIELSNLSPTHVADFIARTLKMKDDNDDDEDEDDDDHHHQEFIVEPLTELVYSTTLGNIFFCRQALEELVRKNALYYDVICFEWRLQIPSTATGLGLDKNKNKNSSPLLSEDVLEMVQAKLQGLPAQLQTALTLAAYIRNSFDIPILLASLLVGGQQGNKNSTTTHPINAKLLESLLDRAVTEGLLFESKQDRHPPHRHSQVQNIKSYKFAHDRVQEAAYKLVSEGEDRYQIQVQVATALVEQATMMTMNQNVSHHDTYRQTRDHEWMFFVAVDHFNSVPSEYVTDVLQLASLNLKVAEMCLAKASFAKAVDLLRAGVACFGADKDSRSKMWKENYELLLTLHDRLLEIGVAVGNYREAETAIAEVVQRAECLEDSCIAHYTNIHLQVQLSNENSEVGIQESLKVLRTFGQYIPKAPTKAAIIAERLHLKLALGTRPLSVLAEMPIMEQDGMVRLLSQLCRLSTKSRNEPLNTFVALRAMRLSLEKGISKHLPEIVTTLSFPLRLKCHFQQAYSYATLVAKLYDRFPNERGGDYVTGQVILYSGMLSLKQKFQDHIDIFFRLYRMGLAAGNTEMALSAAMLFTLVYYLSGLPLNALLEPKLIMFEEKARQLCQPGFVIIFQCHRQVMYNLQGKSANPTELKGEAMDETMVISQLEGNAKKMAIRDLSTLRLMLACVFGDIATMELAMQRLDPYPFFDLPLTRQHLRLTFHGIAALTVGRQKKNKELLKTGHALMKELRKLDRIGSVNAHPSYLCLQAVGCSSSSSSKRKGTRFEDAIAACVDAQLVHMEAIMCEHYGVWLLEIINRGKASSSNSSEDDDDDAKKYLSRALWLYQDWGAIAKVDQLEEKFPFLKALIPRRPDCRRRSSLSNILLKANKNKVESTAFDASEPLEEL